MFTTNELTVEGRYTSEWACLFCPAFPPLDTILVTVSLAHDAIALNTFDFCPQVRLVKAGGPTVQMKIVKDVYVIAFFVCN